MSDVQPLNTPLPIVVTESGITIEGSDVHSWNTQLPIVVTESGITIEVSDLQLWNTLLPIVVTESEITIEVSDSQPLNTLLPIIVIESATFTLTTFSGTLPLPSYMYVSSFQSVGLVGQNWVVTRAVVVRFYARFFCI